jgi:hypothetical protein
MAKPIPRTPILRGKAAVEFIKRMIKEETDPDPDRITMLKKARNMKFNVIL